MQENNSCICAFGRSCREDRSLKCSCATSISSFGCRNCAAYGSKEQRESMAKYLWAQKDKAEAMENHLKYLRIRFEKILESGGHIDYDDLEQVKALLGEKNEDQ